MANSFARIVVVACFVAGVFAGHARAAERPPNIVLIYADDVGYGDLSCYGATKIKTPHLDRLAAEGLRFTDGHSAAATCTPSRYALLTGQYAWRKKGTGVLPGDANLIIEPSRMTLPRMLKQAGYATGVVGKWHLGLGQGPIDWNTEIRPGPLELGFDASFIIPATGDRVPCVYVKDRRVAGLDASDPIEVSYQARVGDEPTGRDHPELLKMKLSHGHDFTIVNGISRVGWMRGGQSARWVDEDMADAITRQATQFIDDHREGPFFLYFATHDAHVPRVPHARFRGTSGCGVRGDVIQELDWCVGQVLAKLDELDLARDTLVMFTSDNGPVIDDGYADGAVEDLNGHQAAGPLRGTKYSPYEGGTRVPWLARWPGRIEPGTSEALVCQVDLLASLAALSGQTLADGDGPDSENVLSAFLGESHKGRDLLVEQAGKLSLRQGPWKYIPPGGPKAGQQAANQKLALGELYNLADDLGETKNLAAQQPERVAELRDALAQIRSAFDPTDRYDVEAIEGWSVRINRAFREKEPELYQDTLATLRHQLYQIARNVPPKPVDKLRRIVIWVEEAEPHHPCMAYHPDAGWLREHDMNPEKARCVELANARNFLKWTHEQPWMVFHELAHGYHHQFLDRGFDHDEVRAAFERAKDSKSYENVLRASGRRERHYALTNPQEYFAEASEAYFGTNDFYPYVRAELREHDPEGCDLLTRLWEVE